LAIGNCRLADRRLLIDHWLIDDWLIADWRLADRRLTIDRIHRPFDRFSQAAINPQSIRHQIRNQSAIDSPSIDNHKIDNPHSAISQFAIANWKSAIDLLHTS
jgi:hypothetical protein